MSFLTATPSSMFGLAPRLTIKGSNAEISSGHPINNDVGFNSRERRSKIRFERELERKHLKEQGYDLESYSSPKAALERLSDYSLTKLMERLRAVDVGALDFEECPPLAVTLNYPREASGPQIKGIYKGVSKAIKAHTVYSKTAGEVYREVSPLGIFHEHMVLVVPGPMSEFAKWLSKRLRYHCRKQGLTPAVGALHVDALRSEVEWHRWCGYPAKKSKQETRRMASLPGGGAWTHRFEPLPQTSKIQRGLKSGAQYYALLALLAVSTGKPKDFRTRRVHLDSNIAKWYADIVSRIGDLDVPWTIPKGVVQEEYECVITTDKHGAPTKLRFYYGDVTETRTIEVGIQGLEDWGRELLRRYRKLGNEGFRKPQYPASLIHTGNPSSFLCFHVRVSGCPRNPWNRGPPCSCINR